MKINYNLIRGDCLIEMDKIADESVNMVLADLPFGTTNCAWDTIINLEKLWEQYNRIIKPKGAILLFAQTPFDKVLGASNLEQLRYEWIWEKTTSTGHLNAKKMPMKAHENILVFYDKLPIYNPQMTTGHAPVNSYTKHQSDGEIYGKTRKGISGGGSTLRYPRSVLRYPTDKQTSSLHPTQKPVALLEYFIKTYTHTGHVILDNTMGSGSTGVAAARTHRKFIGIELEEKYFNIAEERIQAAYKKESFLGMNDGS